MIAVLVTLAMTFAAPPMQTAPARPSPDVEERATDAYEALLGEYQAEFLVWRKALREERDVAKRRELNARHPARAFEPRFRALGDEGDARALVWLLQNATALRAAEEGRAFREEIARRLIRDHADAPIFGERGIDLVLNEQETLGVESCEALLRELAAATSSRQTRLKTLRRLAVYLALVEDEAANARGHALFETLIADAEEAGDEPLARDLRGELIRRRDLRVGRLAPDFEARTVDGETFRLSDLRGKVVLIDFWGFWCATCRRELPHLKDVRDRFADEPFAIVGVATDEDAEEFRKLAAENGVDWLNVWDGATDGPLSTAWGVGFFPTTYLLDAEGRIRKANLRVQYLALAVKQLLAELEEDGE